MTDLRTFVVRHRRPVLAALVAGIALLIFVLVWFQPQKLLINRTIEDPLAGDDRNVTIASGSFRSLDHETAGHALVVRTAGGALSLRLEDLDTTNGPDLRVYLSPVPADRNGRAFGEDALDLGSLKGNRGDQNYSIPEGTDPSRYRSVVIWCRRFTVGFGVAPLG